MNQTVADKGTDLLAFLKATATLRRRRISSYGDSDRVMWFGDVPSEHAECRSPFLVANPEDPGELWLEVRKKRMPMRPPVPESVADWVHPDELDQTETEPDLYAEIPVLVEAEQDPFESDDSPEERYELRRLADYPDVEDAWLEYLADEWEPWAKEMRRWQEVQSTYESLAFMRPRLEEAEERYELVLAVGLLHWRDPVGTGVKRHLLTAPAEIVLDAARGVLNVVPAASFERFGIELDMLELQHQPSLDGAVIESQLDELDIQVWKTSHVAPVLRDIANRLHADTQIDETRLAPTDRTEEYPWVSYAPALVLRERRPTAYDDLIRKLLEAAGNNGLQTTRPWRLLLREGEASWDATGEFEIERDQDALGQGRLDRFLFPKPANDEQREMVNRLHNNPCVLVKGPPGTGKSHTIANLICHLLAKGDRILVTAQAPKALTVLGGLLPGEVRHLSVTALGSSREDQRLLEESVRGILRRKNEWRGPAHDQDIIERTERRLQTLEGELAKIQRYLQESREAETHSHALPGGYEGTAAQIARTLDERREQFGWLPESDGFDNPFPLNDADAALLTQIHANLDHDTLAELRLETGVAQLPDPDRFKALVATLETTKESAARATGTTQPEKLETLERNSSQSLDELHAALMAMEHLAAKATRVLGDLTETILADLLVGRVEPWNRLESETEAVLSNAAALLTQVGIMNVELSSKGSPEHLLADARRRLVHFRQGGNRGFGFLAPRIVKDTAYVARSCLVDGRRPDDVERLAIVVASLELDRNIHELARLRPNAMLNLPSRKQVVAFAQDLTNELRVLFQFFDSKHAASVTGLLAGEPTSLASPAERKAWLGAIVAELARRAARSAQENLALVSQQLFE